ncbi:MAG: DUF2061 domain-containing protein [Holosporales bacterium]
MTTLIFHHKTTFKTITYCAMHFTVAIMLTYALTKNWSLALSLGILEPLVQTLFFNLHERGWKLAEQRHILAKITVNSMAKS